MQIQVVHNNQKSQGDRLLQLTPVQLSCLSTVFLHLAIALSGATARASEPALMEAEPPSPPITSTVEVPAVPAVLEPSTTAAPTTVAEGALIQPSVRVQEPSDQVITPAPASPPVAEVSSPLPAVSKQASDLIGASTPQSGEQEPLAQTETSAPADSSSDAKSVNNPLLPPPGWRFDFEPYVFLPFSVKGDIFIGRGRNLLFPNRPRVLEQSSGINLGVNANLSDITAKLTNLFGASGRFQAWNGNVGVVAEGVYINSGFRSSSDGGTLTFRDRFNIPVPGFQIDTRTTISSFSLGASYLLGPFPLRTITDPANPRNYYPAISVEALVGLRYLSVFQDIDFERGPRFEFSGSEFNPMLGGTVKLLVSDRFAFFFRGDTSNLGGGNLKQYYNLYAGVDWKFSGSFALRLAYRFNQIEFVKRGPFGGDNGLNLRNQGMQLGISWQF